MASFTRADVVTIDEAIDAADDCLGFGGDEELFEDLIINLHDLRARLLTAIEAGHI